MERTEFVISEVLPGKLNALVKNLMSQMDIDDPNEAVRRVNSGDWVVSNLDCLQREEYGIIRFSVTSDGTTGDDWIAWSESNGFYVDASAKSVLRSSDFKPTTGMITEVVVIKGMLFKDGYRMTKNIRAVADKRKYLKPNAELACLIHKKFSDKELNKEIEAMGLECIVPMHDPIKDSDCGPSLLGANRLGDRPWLAWYDADPGREWERDYGFAFAVSQACSS